jgi:hypothetical protein
MAVMMTRRVASTSCRLSPFVAALTAALATTGAVGCGADESEAGGGGPVPSGPCQPGELTQADGSCVAAGEGAGIPPELCGVGFVADNARLGIGS